jgi:hypothetical protein
VAIGGSRTRPKPDGEPESRASNGNRGASLALAFPEELIEAIAERAAALVAARESAPEDGWLRGADRIAAYLDCHAAASTLSPPRGGSRSITTARR